MERLTTTNEHGKPILKALPNYEEYDLVCRLFAYEDTGLEPEAVEQIKLAFMGKSVAEITEFEGVAIARLCELARADREGRCMVVPSDYDGEMFKIWKGQILSSRRFVNNIKELGKTVFLTREEAEEALRREQE